MAVCPEPDIGDDLFAGLFAALFLVFVVQVAARFGFNQPIPWTDELAVVPVSIALAMFNTNTLFRILVEARSRDAITAAKEQATAMERLASCRPSSPPNSGNEIAR